MRQSGSSPGCGATSPRAAVGPARGTGGALTAGGGAGHAGGLPQQELRNADADILRRGLPDRRPHLLDGRARSPAAPPAARRRSGSGAWRKPNTPVTRPNSERCGSACGAGASGVRSPWPSSAPARTGCCSGCGRLDRRARRPGGTPGEPPRRPGRRATSVAANAGDPRAPSAGLPDAHDRRLGDRRQHRLDRRAEASCGIVGSCGIASAPRRAPSARSASCSEAVAAHLRDRRTGLRIPPRAAAKPRRPREAGLALRAGIGHVVLAADHLQPRRLRLLPGRRVDAGGDHRDADPALQRLRRSPSRR